MELSCISLVLGVNPLPSKTPENAFLLLPPTTPENALWSWPGFNKFTYRKHGQQSP